MKSLYLYCFFICTSFLVSCKVQNPEPVIPSEAIFTDNNWIIKLDSNSRTFVQRSNLNSAEVVFSAKVKLKISKAEIRFKNYLGGQTLDFVPLNYRQADSTILGTYSLAGGGYYPEVRLYDSANNIVADSLVLKRFCVGEVFAIIGHSLAEGQVPYVINDYNKNWNDVVLWPQVDPNVVPNASFWGRLGELLVTKLNVPIMIYNTGIGGSSSSHWGYSAMGFQFESSIFDWKKRYPYLFFENRINNDFVKTGLRAILVMHGENDIKLTQNEIIETTKLYVNKTRELLKAPELTFAISKCINPPIDIPRNSEVVAAQKRMLTELPNVSLGADLQSITNRWDGIHFDYQGLELAARAWNVALTTDFFINTKPILKTK